MKSRTTLRRLTNALGIGTSTVYDNLGKLGLRRASRFLRPLLSATNQTASLEWALRFLVDTTSEQRRFHSFRNFLHLDEKWIYI